MDAVRSLDISGKEKSQEQQNKEHLERLEELHRKARGGLQKRRKGENEWHYI